MLTIDRLIELPTLDRVIDRAFVTVTPETPVMDAVALMSQIGDSCAIPNLNLLPECGDRNQERTSCVLVVDGLQLVGILTQRDVVQFAASGMELSGVKVAQVMTQPVMTLTLSNSHNVLTVLTLMRQHQLRHLPIVDEGRLIGIVTPASIRKVLQPANLLKLRQVADVMSTEVIHAVGSTSLLGIAQLMAQHRVSCVVIVEFSTQESGVRTQESGVRRKRYEGSPGGSEGAFEEKPSTHLPLSPSPTLPLSPSPHLPIPVGIITERDIVQFQVLELNLTQTQAIEVMSQPLFYLNPANSLWFAHEEMQLRHLRCLIVTGEQGELRGIVTQTSLLRVFDPVEMAAAIEVLQQQLLQQTQELNRVNQQLQQEVNQRQKVEAQYQAQQKLEKQGVERTSEVRQSSHKLQEVLKKLAAQSPLLQHSEQALRFKLSAIVDNAIAAINSFRVFPNHEWKLDYCSPSCEAIFGYTEAEFKADENLWSSQILAEDWENIIIPALTDIFAEKTTKLEYRFRDRNGSLRWICQTAISRRDEIADCWYVTTVATNITPRKQTEAQLRQSEARYRTICLLTSDFIYSCYVTPEGAIVSEWATPNLHRITGYTFKELLSGENGWLDVVYFEDLPVVYRVINEMIAYNQPRSLEYRIVTKLGEIRWICDRIQPQWDDRQQRVVQLLGAVEDISERKLAESKLRESEARFRIMADTAPVLIWMAGTDNLCNYFNQSWLKFTGRTLEQEQGNGWAQSVHPEDLERCLNICTTSFDSRQPFTMEYRLRRCDGEYRWILDTGNPRFHPDGSFAGYIGSCIDISERKQAEQKIAAQAALLDVATDAIFVCGLDNQIIFWNQSASLLYGWQAAEALGKNANQLLYQDSPELEIAQKKVFELNSWQGELQKVNKCGKEIIVESRWTLVRDSNGEPQFILIVDTDITEKKELQAQFHRTQRLENLGTLASGIAHDLNNILTPILAVAQILQFNLSETDEQQEMMNILETNAKRGADLVKQVLSFARGSEGKRTVVQIRHLLKEIESFAKGTFPKSIEIISDTPSNLWTVTADFTQLHQVLMNLVVNARDAMPNGGILNISASNVLIDENYASMHLEAKIGSYIVISITDTGMGIAPEILERIFEPFFTTKEQDKGTGLGLSTVRGIVKSHGGFIDVSSHLGKGSRFQIYLPATEGCADLAAEQLELPSGNAELILVVDDEAAICETTKTVLESHNYRVLTANDGIEAIALYAQHKHEIDLILIDMMMPSMDGSTAILAMQRMNPQVQIVAMSGMTATQVLSKRARTNIQAILLKPFTTWELLNTFHRVLKKSE